ncbi:MAG: phosphotransferase [Mycobacterium sp.]
MRVPRHPAPDRPGPGRIRRRVAGPPARDVLGAPARAGRQGSAGLALHRLRRQCLHADRPAVEDIVAPPRRADRPTAGARPVHQRALPRGRGTRRRPPHTVMHGDAHPGNLYFRDGQAGLLDWQAVRRGHPGRELAYTLVTSMTREQRQATQRDLLDVYRDALAGAGGPELDRDELWNRYGRARCNRTPPL